MLRHFLSLRGGAFADSYSAGSGASAGGSQSIAIGNNATTTTNNGIAIGDGAKVNQGTTQNSIAIGKGANAGGYYGYDNVVIGTNAQSNSSAAVVIGQNARITRMQGNRSVVIGNNATTENTGSVVIGDGAQAAGGGGVSVGQESYNNNGWASALGFQARAEGGNSTSIGAKARTAGQNAGAFGFEATANGQKAYAMGNGTNANAEGSLALGSTANASANLAQAIGWAASSSGTSATALGVGSNASGQSSVAIGHNAAVTTTKNVSLGADSTDDGTSTAAGLSYATALSGVAGTPNAVVSVGKADFTRKLSYVGAGVADTDAVNVAQLKSLADNKLSLTADGNTRTDKIALGVTGDTTDTRLSLGIIGDGSYIKTEATGTNVKVSFNAAKMAKNSPTVYVNGDGEIVAQGTDGKFYPIKDLNDDGTPKAGATAVPEGDLKVVTNTPKAAGDNTTTANTPNDLNGIKSALNVPNLNNINNNDTAAPAITADDAKTAVAGNDNNGTGGLYAIQGGNNLLKAVNLGDLQAVAKAGANYTADKAGTVVNRPLGTAMAFVTGNDAEGSNDFEAAGGTSNLGTIISTTDNKISFVMKKKPTFEGLTLAKDGNTVNMEPTAKGLDMGGSKITNIGDGEISATSTDAITGKQIAGLKHNITSTDNTITVSNGGALFENNVDLSIADGAITADKLANGAVTGDKIAADAITGNKIKNGTITADKLAPGVISGDSLTAGAVDADKLAANSVTGDKIENGAVDTDKLANNAVDSSKLADNAVTENKIAPNAVTSDKIKEGAVTTDKLGANAVTTDKINNGAVTSDKLGAGAVTTEKIANGAITAEKIADGSITADKIAAGSKGDITSQTLQVTDGTGKVLGGNVTIELKANSIDEDKLDQALKDKLAKIDTNEDNIANKLDGSKAQFNLAGDDTNTTHNVNLNTAAVPTVQVKGDNSTISVTLDNGGLKVAAQTASTKDDIDDANNAGKLATAGGVKAFVAGQGLNFVADDTAVNAKIFRAMGETLKISATNNITTADENQYTTANLGTKIDTAANSITVMMKKDIAVDTVTIGGNQDPANNTKLGVDANGNIILNPKDPVAPATAPTESANPKKIIGIADGVEDNDAVNVNQLNSALADVRKRINYLDSGTSGNVVYTDKEGNRVVPYVAPNGKMYFYKLDELKGKNLKVTVTEDPDTKKKIITYYDHTNPNSPVKVDDVRTKLGNGLPQFDIGLSTVNVDGYTTNPEEMGNISSALGLDNMKVEIPDDTSDAQRPGKIKEIVNGNKGLAPINPANIEKARTAIAGADQDGKGGIYGVNGRDLYKATNLGDLQAVAAAGLTFNTNETVTGTNDDQKNIHRPLGTLINIIGKEIPTKVAYDVATYQGKYTAENIITTIKDSNTIQIQFKDTPEFAGLDLVQRDKDPKSKGKVLNRINMTIGGENGDKLVFGGGNDPDPANNNKPVVLSGVKEDPNDDNSVLTRQSLKGIDDQIDKKIGKFNDDLNSRFDDIAQGASAGTASAMAAAGVPQIINVDAQNLIGVGFGNYNGERAIAIGYTGTNKDRDVIYRLTGTYDSSKKIGLSAGVGFTFGKKTSYKEDQIVRENNFYEIIQRQQFEIASLRDMNAKNQEEIAELKAQIKLILEKQK